MLHACRIKDGKVSYCNRYVATARLARERSLGFPIYMRVRPGSARAQVSCMLGLLNPSTWSSLVCLCCCQPTCVSTLLVAYIAHSCIESYSSYMRLAEVVYHAAPCSWAAS